MIMLHASKSTKELFSKNNIQIMDWPSRSPDPNHMENLWGRLVRAIYKN